MKLSLRLREQQDSRLLKEVGNLSMRDLCPRAGTFTQMCGGLL